MNDSSAYRSKPHILPGATDLPRIIVWQLAPRSDGSAGDPSLNSPTRHDEPLNTSECLLVIDSIARTAKPIVVLTGERVLELYPRLPEILEYGRALGLKMIVEVPPAELTDEVIDRYRYFGERIFRVKITAPVGDDTGSRIEEASFFAELDGSLDRLGKAGFEIHLVYTATEPDLRTLALLHDYAVRRSARGLYCHLRFDLAEGQTPIEGGVVDDFIERFATMKEYSPASMIISPQCVRFVHHSHRQEDHGQGGGNRGSWEYVCLAGKSYAFIDPAGRVQLCAGNSDKRPTLRDAGYDFQKVWGYSSVFTDSRKTCRNCLHGYHSADQVAADRAVLQGSPPGAGSGAAPA